MASSEGLPKLRQFRRERWLLEPLLGGGIGSCLETLHHRHLQVSARQMRQLVLGAVQPDLEAFLPFVLPEPGVPVPFAGFPLALAGLVRDSHQCYPRLAHLVPVELGTRPVELGTRDRLAVQVLVLVAVLRVLVEGMVDSWDLYVAAVPEV